MGTAVAVIQSETDFLVMLVINSAEKRLDTFVAVDDGGDTFLTAPDAESWANLGIIRRLRTKGLSAGLKAALHTSFIEDQVAQPFHNFHPCEVCINKGAI